MGIIKTFKQWLAEKQFKKGYTSGEYTKGILETIVFVNPSKPEWKILGSDARGIITENGDLYAITKSGGSISQGIVIHVDFIEYLQNVVKMGNFPPESFPNLMLSMMKIVPVQRYKFTNRIYISESMDQDIIYNEHEEKYILKVFVSAKRKNKSLDFYGAKVMYGDRSDVEKLI